MRSSNQIGVRRSTRRLNQKARNNSEGSSKDSKFNPNSSDINIGWSSSSETIVCVNPYPNGITVSIHHNKQEQTESPQQLKQYQFYLRFADTKDYQLPAGKQYLYRDNYIQGLEHHLSQLNKNGQLKSAVIYFGMVSDPYSNFHQKFHVTLACLQLFEQYQPKKLVIQSRSPMVISGLPAFKLLGKKAVVAIPVESRSESAIRRYTPGQPTIEQRLLAVKGLRAQGIEVNLVVGPLLPYGESTAHLKDFAKILAENADYITFGGLVEPGGEDLQLKNLTVVRKLIADNQLATLRPYSFKDLYLAVKELAPEKLIIPQDMDHVQSQLKLFAA